MRAGFCRIWYVPFGVRFCGRPKKEGVSKDLLQLRRELEWDRSIWGETVGWDCDPSAVL